MTHKSPNNKHGFDFLFKGEIRFGPEYYRVKLNEEVVQHRIFGFHFKWSTDSKYLALQEWLYANERKGPYTFLSIIDVESCLIARISQAKGGFTKPMKFNDDKIIYQKEFLSKGKVVEYEMKIDKINNWEEL